MTPGEPYSAEELAIQVAWLNGAADSIYTKDARLRPQHAARLAATLAELERLRQDALRWRTIRPMLDVETDPVGEPWWQLRTVMGACRGPKPATIYEAVDRLTANVSGEAVGPDDQKDAGCASSEPCSGGAIGRHAPSPVENRDSGATPSPLSGLERFVPDSIKRVEIPEDREATRARIARLQKTSKEVGEELAARSLPGDHKETGL